MPGLGAAASAFVGILKIFEFERIWCWFGLAFRHVRSLLHNLYGPRGVIPLSRRESFAITCFLRTIVLRTVVPRKRVLGNGSPGRAPGWRYGRMPSSTEVVYQEEATWEPMPV